MRLASGSAKCSRRVRRDIEKTRPEARNFPRGNLGVDPFQAAAFSSTSSASRCSTHQPFGLVVHRRGEKRLGDPSGFPRAWAPPCRPIVLGRRSGPTGRSPWLAHYAVQRRRLESGQGSGPTHPQNGRQRNLASQREPRFCSLSAARGPRPCTPAIRRGIDAAILITRDRALGQYPIGSHDRRRGEIHFGRRAGQCPWP